MEIRMSSSTLETEITFEFLPDVVLGKIMSYLHWKEKELLAIASGRIRYLIETPFAWEYFENDRNYAFHSLFKFMQFSFLLEQEIEMIRQYGKYFQRCKLWLYSMDLDLDLPQKNNSTWDTGNNILRTVSVHCKQLKWLCVVHSSDTSLAHLQHSSDYIKSLHDILSGQTKKCSLSLRNLFYSSMDLSNSVIDNYMYLLTNADLFQNITCLDISHGLISDRTYRPAYGFKLCKNMVILKCPIHAVNTNIIIELCNQRLLYLYLVSDEHTKDMGFWEKSFLDWTLIHTEMRSKMRSCFEVHYIVQNRTFDLTDFVPNPFTKSLILNNLTCCLSASLLRAMVDNYGSSLENLAFCSNYWEFLMHFTDLSEINNSMAYVGETCIVLKSFISCLKLPSSAIYSLARNSQTITNVRVYKDNVILSQDDQPVNRFQEKMAHLLGESKSGWQMVDPGENIFDIPTVNPILFHTCFRKF